MPRTARPGEKRTLVQLKLDKQEVEQLKSIQARHRAMDASFTQAVKLCIRLGIAAAAKEGVVS